MSFTRISYDASVDLRLNNLCTIARSWEPNLAAHTAASLVHDFRYALANLSSPSSVVTIRVQCAELGLRNDYDITNYSALSALVAFIEKHKTVLHYAESAYITYGYDYEYDDIIYNYRLRNFIRYKTTYADYINKPWRYIDEPQLQKASS